jgi:type IV pilus assembly protein PilP
MRQWSVFGIAAVALVACGDSTTTAATPAPVAKKAPRPVIDAGVVTAIEPFQYMYSSMGKRDPFRASGSIEETAPVGGPIATCDEPLCQLDLDELKLVAVVSGDSNPVAMLEDRGGVGHLVRRNSKIGRQAGKVTSILRDCIVVTAFVKGPDGRDQPNRQNLCVSTEGQASNGPVLDLMSGKPRE